MRTRRAMLNLTDKQIAPDNEFRTFKLNAIFAHHRLEIFFQKRFAKKFYAY